MALFSTLFSSLVSIFSFAGKNTLKIIGFGTITLFLASCGGDVVRTEAEYIDVATEAHAVGDSRLALFELGAGIRNFPENSDIQLLRGNIFLDLENGSAAEIAFNKAIALGYNRDFIKHELAESWLYQRNPAKVIDTLEKEILQGSQDALLYEVVGRAYIATRDRTNPTLFLKSMNAAEKYIEEAYRLNSNNTRVLITKAWLSAIMGKLDDALGWLNQADQIITDQRQNLIVKAELLIRQDNVDQAQEVYKRLIKKFPQYPQYKLELGYTYILSHDYDTSRKWIEPIAQQYPAQMRPKYLLSNISLMEKKYEEAKQLSNAVLAKSPEDLQSLIINGASSYFLGEFENAHQKLGNFYGRTGSIPALKLLAATKLKLGENLAAAQLLEAAGQTTETPTDAELLNLVATASAKIGKMDVALEAYKKLAEQSPGTSSFKNNMGLIQIAQGKYDEGFENLELALEKETTTTEPGRNLSILAAKALETRQYDRAAAYIEQYKTVAKDNHKPWVMSAVLQSILKNNTAVREDFDKAMKIAPDVADIKARYAIFEKFQGNQDRALDLAVQALKLEPANFGAGKIVLADLVEQKNFEQVKKVIDLAVKQDKATDFSKLIFADYYTFLGRPQETLAIIEQLPNTVKASSTYMITAGKAYLRNGQAQRAVDLLEGFSLRIPNNIQAQKLLLQGYILTHDQIKYLATLEKIDRLIPGDYNNQVSLVELYISTGKNDAAEKILNSLKSETDQQILQKNLLLATVETNRGNIKKSLTILAPLYEQSPQNGGVSMLYSRNLANDNRVKDAINVSTIWADQHVGNLVVKQFLGDLYLRSNDNVNASLQYEAILAAKDKANTGAKIHAHNNLAMIYLEDGQDQKAMDHAQRAIDMAPNNPAIVDTYAQVLLKQGKAEQAVDQFNQALALLPDSDRKNRSLFTMGKAKALIQSGQKEKAQRILTRLIKDDPGFSQIIEARKILSEL